MTYTIDYLKTLNEGQARKLFKVGEVFSFYMEDEDFDEQYYLVIEETKQETERFISIAMYNPKDKMLRSPSSSILFNDFLIDFSKLLEDEKFYSVKDSIKAQILLQRSVGNYETI